MDSHPQKQSPTRGASFTLSTVLTVADKNRDPLEIDHPYIASVAPEPNAALLTREHHEAKFGAATHGKRTAVKAWITNAKEVIAACEEACDRIARNLEKLEPNITIPGGDQPRTPLTWVQLFCLMGVAVGIFVSDWFVIQSLAAEVVGPELAGDFKVIFPIAFAMGAATIALKLYPTLRYHTEAEKLQFFRQFARLLPWTVPLIILAIAKRLAGWTVNPLETILGEANASLDLALTIGGYLAQLGAMAVVAAAALMAAGALLHATRASSSRPNPDYVQLKAQLDPEARLLDGNRRTLGGFEALLAALEAELKDYLDQADAALRAEQAEIESTSRRLGAMRPARGVALDTSVNGHRFGDTSTRN